MPAVTTPVRRSRLPWRPATAGGAGVLALLLLGTTGHAEAGPAFGLAVLTGLHERVGDIPYAVAVGALAGSKAIGEDLAAAAYLQTLAANLISAAVRLVPLGQSVGLAVLAALEPVIAAVALDTGSAGLHDLGGCALRSDLAAMRHETQYTRLFRS